MPKDMPTDVRVEAIAGKPVELPSGHFLANADMSRAGMDLHITGSDGHTIVVEGYFAQQVPPDLVTHDGARLTPAMVNAFVPPEHAGQYAASGQTANDASPAGHITKVVGDAHIIHADGTKTVAHEGSLIYQGDVVETSKTGAVNMQFSDNTTFAISDNARMSVDQFVYHASNHTGSTFFSMLQGVFVYTSGLIGKSDPGSVNIETPVGSIGIRGTVIAAHILPAGQHSQITIVDGAITLTNGTGTQELNDHLQTVSVNGYQSQPQSVSMDANTFNSAYSSMSSVVGGELSHFTGMGTSAPAEHAVPAPVAPAAENIPSAPASTGSSFSGTGSSSFNTAPTSTEGSTSSSSSQAGISGNTGSAVVVPGNGGYVPPPPPPPPPVFSVTATPNYEVIEVGASINYTLTFSEALSQAEITAIHNNPLAYFTSVGSAPISTITVNEIGTDGEHLSLSVAATNSGTLQIETLSNSIQDINTDYLASTPLQTMIATQGVYTTTTGTGDLHFSTNSGSVTLGAQSIYNLGDTALTVHADNSVTGTSVNIDNGGSIPLHLTSDSWNGTQLILNYTGAAANGNTITLNVNENTAAPIFVNDGTTYSITSSTFTNATTTNASGGNEVLIGTASVQQTLSDGDTTHTQDVLIGNNAGAGNTIEVSNNGFLFIDGGMETQQQFNINVANGGNGNILLLSPVSYNTDSVNIDFSSNNVTNIDTIIFNESAPGNSVTLNVQDVFNMTNAADNHTLLIYANNPVIGVDTVNLTTNSGFQSVTNIDTATSNPTLDSTLTKLLGTSFTVAVTTALGSLGQALTNMGDSAYQGHAANGATVTLVVEGTSTVGPVQHTINVVQH
jgi:hypothetical protein